jgi:hypothetical protein
MWDVGERDTPRHNVRYEYLFLHSFDFSRHKRGRHGFEGSATGRMTARRTLDLAELREKSAALAPVVGRFG